MRKTVFIAGLLVIFTGFASSTSISSENITVDLDDNTVNAQISVNELTSSSFTYITNHPVENHRVEINDEAVECDFEPMTRGGEIQCPTELEGNFTADLTYETSGLVTPQNGINIFRYSQSIYRPVDTYNFKVILPEGTGIVDQANVSTPVISPENGEVGSEGRRIHVEWDENPSFETLSFEVNYEQLSPDFRPVIILITLFLLALGVVKFYRDRKSKNEVSDVIDSLTEDEKLVFKLIQEEESILQKDIVQESDYSKAKISGVVSSLEQKDMVTKEKEGRSNRISAKEEFLD